MFPNEDKRLRDEQVLLEYTPFIVRIASLYRGELEYDDAFQIASEGFLEGYKLYDPARSNGMKISSFACLIAKQKLQAELRKLYRQKKGQDGSLYTFISFEMLEEEAGIENNSSFKKSLASSCVSTQREYENIELRCLLDQALNCLPQTTREVVEDYFFKNLTQNEIAKKNKCSQALVSNRIKKGLKILRRYMTQIASI